MSFDTSVVEKLEAGDNRGRCKNCSWDLEVTPFDQEECVDPITLDELSETDSVYRTSNGVCYNTDSLSRLSIDPLTRKPLDFTRVYAGEVQQMYFVVSYVLSNVIHYAKMAYTSRESAQAHLKRLDGINDIKRLRICEVTPTRWGRQRLTYNGIRTRVFWANDCQGEEREFWLDLE